MMNPWPYSYFIMAVWLTSAYPWSYTQQLMTCVAFTLQFTLEVRKHNNHHIPRSIHFIGKVQLLALPLFLNNVPNFWSCSVSVISESFDQN